VTAGPGPPTVREVLGVPLPPAPVVNAVMRLRGRFNRRSSRALPPQVVALERSFGLLDTVATRTLVELGVPEALRAGPASSVELARRLACDPDGLHRLLRFSSSRGLLGRDRRGRFRANRVSEVLCADHPTSMAAWARSFGAPWYTAIWAEAPHSVRTGDSATRIATGHEFFEYLHSAEPVAGTQFDAAMADGARLLGLLLAESVDWDGARRLCDVGGGTGRHLADILARRPSMTGVLFDLPEVVGRAASLLSDAGVADRVEVAGGDFFDFVPPGCDRYLLTAIVHDWDDEHAAAVLGNVRDAVDPGGRVLVVESRLHDDDVWEMAKASDLMMLVLTGSGRERTREEMGALGRRAGLRVDRVTPLATGFDVTELVPA
jgi:SAM-dependent methyltransferase